MLMRFFEQWAKDNDPSPSDLEYMKEIINTRELNIANWNIKRILEDALIGHKG
jgi:hypothetical protein